jgi:hypothetical protein
VSAESLTLCVSTAQDILDTARFTLAADAFGDGRAMARPARGFVRPYTQRPGRWEAVITVKTRRATMRLASRIPGAADVNPGTRAWLDSFRKQDAAVSYPGTRIRKDPPNNAGKTEWAARYFPYGESFNEDTHVFARERFPGANAEEDSWLMLALPLPLADALVEMCGAWGIKPGSVRRIGILEHALMAYYGGICAEPLWLFLPLEDGIRLMFLYNGQPREIFYVSWDPSYRETELDRIFWTADFPPEAGYGILIGDAEDGTGNSSNANTLIASYDWLLRYFSARGFDVSIETLAEDFRRKAAFL